MLPVPTALEGLLGHGQEPGRTIRQPSSALLLVDSADRRQSSTLGDNTLTNLQAINNFTLQKRQTFLSGYFNRLAVSEIRFPFSTPNVNLRNNKIVVNSITVDLDEAYYTPSELAQNLQIALNADIPGNNFQVTYNEALGTFSITGTSNFTVAPFVYPNSAQTLKGLYYMMNFGASPLSGTNTYQSNPGPNMQYTAYIDICSRALTQYQQVKDNSSRENQSPGLLCRLYLNNFTNENLGDGGTSAKLVWPGCRPQLIHRAFPQPKFASWSPGQFIDQIDIALYDDIGQPLYYNDADPNGVYSHNDFQLTFLASEN